MIVYSVIVVFISSLSHLYGVHGLCPDGFERHGEACYNVFSLEASWIEAKLYCRALGTDLVKIDSADEETIIEGIMSRNAASTTDSEYWTAGADIITEGQWRWMAEDRVSYPVQGYTKWGHGRPNSAVSQQNCMLVHYNHHSRSTYWDDRVCSTHHSFVCEGSISYPQTSIPMPDVTVYTTTSEPTETIEVLF